MARGWARTLTINLQAAADLCRLAVSHFLDRGGRRADHQRHQPRGISRRQPEALALCCVQGRHGRHDQDIARGYAGDGILCFGVAPGFTVSEMTDEYLAGRGGAQIVADIPLGRVASTVEIAEVIRWLAIDAPASATGTMIDANGASYVR